MSAQTTIKRLAGLLATLATGGISVGDEEQAPMWTAIIICIVGMALLALLAVGLYYKLS